MRHQRKLKHTKMLIDAVDYFIHTIQDYAPQYRVNEYQELLKELEEEEALLERTIERNL